MVEPWEEEVAGRLRIVGDGLVGNPDIMDLIEDEGSFAQRQAVIDVIGQDKAKDMAGAAYPGQIDSGRGQAGLDFFQGIQ